MKPSKKIPPGFKRLPVFLFSIFLAFPLPLFAEQIMDTEDTLVVAQRSAFERVKNGYFSDAFSAEQEALRTLENRLGPTHPSLAGVLTDLATIDRYLARYPDAESALKWALALREKAYGPEDPGVGETCGQLSALDEAWGKYGEAEFWGQRALEIRQKQEGEASVDLCEATNQLGMVEFDLGKGEGAKALFEKSLQLQDKLPFDPILKTTTLNGLAKAQESLKRYSDAESSLQKAREAAQKAFAPDSVEVADSMERLADFYHSHNQGPKAVPLYSAALKIYQRFVGSYFGYSALPYVGRLAKAYESVGNDQSALDLWKEDLKSTHDIFGADNPRTALVSMRLARVEKKLGQDKEARENLKEALTALETILPKDHPLVREALEIQSRL